MLNKLKARLFAGGAAGPGPPSTSTTSSAPASSTSKPRYIPNLYPVGDTTVETYFRRLLQDDVDNSVNLVELAREDVVAAAVHVARAGTDGNVLPSQFLPLLTRCITADYDTLQFADEYMAEPEEAGVSALATPLLLQILVAVALKHRHPEMLRDLLKKHGSRKPQPTLFETVGLDAFRGLPRGDSILDDPHYGSKAWALLAEVGWAPPLETAQTPPVGEQPDSEQARHAIAAAAQTSRDDPEGALRVLDDFLARGLDPQPFTGWILGELVKNGTPAMVARFLGVVARKVYDGVPPRPKWPGMQSLVTVAASRAARVSGASEEKKRVSEASEDPSTGVLRVLVDIGGMDIHTESGIWYKAGPDDEHPMSLYRSTRLADGSCADDPPLLAAVHVGNVASVSFLLERGVADRRKGVLDEAIKRAREQQNAEMEGLLQKWKSDRKERKGE